MSAASSVSRHLVDARKGSTDAIQRICDRYYERLAAIARQKLGTFPKRVADEYAIANEVLHEFYQRSQRGDFSGVSSRGDLMSLLVRLTHDKVVDEVRRLSAQKRGNARTRGHSIFTGNDRGEFDNFRGAYETPSTRQILVQQMQEILDRLPDETMRAVLTLRADGCTNDEIAQELNVSVATVERKRRRIREILSDLDPKTD